MGRCEMLRVSQLFPSTLSGTCCSFYSAMDGGCGIHRGKVRGRVNLWPGRFDTAVNLIQFTWRPHGDKTMRFISKFDQNTPGSLEQGPKREKGRRPTLRRQTRQSQTPFRVTPLCHQRCIQMIWNTEIQLTYSASRRFGAVMDEKIFEIGVEEALSGIPPA